MNTTATLATALALSAVALSARAATAQGARGSLISQRDREQAPCAVTRSVIDSARVDAMSVLFSESSLVAELRREQSIPASANQIAVSVVRDGPVCQRLASQLDHALAPSTRLAVLRVGPIFYVRDPDQRRATGLFADTTFHVLMRLGAALDK